MASHTMDPVDWVSVGAVGDPGQRTFYLQARQGREYVAVIVEKEHVVALARVAAELLRRGGAPITREELRRGDLNLEPVQPEWRAGALRAGTDQRGERFLLEIERLEDEGEVMRLTMSRDELVGLAADATYAVEPNTWRRCRRCRRPIDLDRVHAC